MKIPQRTLGKTGQKLSIIGMGGIVVKNAEPSQAAKVVADSIESGINYFDVAPTYGNAEVKLGPALKPFRKEVFLACKTHFRDRTNALKSLNQSLKNLQTDYFDLFQLHGLTDVEEDVKAALSKDGAIQIILEAKKQGIIRHIGFSAHSPEAAITAMNLFDFDTILYPINFCTHFRNNFDTDVIANARKCDVGILALKAMAKQTWDIDEQHRPYKKCWYEPIDDKQWAKLALSWTLSQGVTAALPPGDEKLFRMAMKLVPHCSQITENQTMRLKDFARTLRPILPTLPNA